MNDELNPLSKKIISLLVFEETYENIVEEVKDTPRSEISDELKQLIVQDFVKPCRNLEDDNQSGLMYDSDKMDNYSFRLTAKGMKCLENILKSTKN